MDNWSATMQLRFIRRECNESTETFNMTTRIVVRLILQQKFINGMDTEWRDVPVED